MENSIVEKIHLSDWRGVFYVTGGGSLLLSDLLTVPGASATVLDARIPYAGAALEEATHQELVQACSSTAAQTLAMQAFLKARELDSHRHLFGLGVTASLATNREKKGRLRAYIALQTASKTQVSELVFSRDTSRMEQEQLLAETSLRKLASGLSIKDSLKASGSDRVANATEPISRLLGEKSCFVGNPHSVFLPGAFNPLHRGHRRMKEMAEQFCGAKVQYELCVRNIDKPPLDFLEIERLGVQFSKDELVLTNVPKLRDKATLLAPSGNAIFVVGVDTLLRVVDPSYYRDEDELESTLDLFYSRNDRFLVFGRTIEDRRFVTLDDMEIPENLRHICVGFTERQFRMDISSTEIRLRSSED
ncbi:MAG: hypothetical protein F4X44_07910 [Gammaproteobacteria bacterium]|nr:hypothetical protein [Gammaproteobacteria bacterium]MYD80522.1 hypothetical protein [Gammaproteobacteria bacterium]